MAKTFLFAEVYLGESGLELVPGGIMMNVRRRVWVEFIEDGPNKTVVSWEEATEEETP